MANARCDQALGRLKQEDCKFKASLAYVLILSQNKNKQKKRVEA
jgi:hypothetical protein